MLSFSQLANYSYTVAGVQEFTRMSDGCGLRLLQPSLGDGTIEAGNKGEG